MRAVGQALRSPALSAEAINAGKNQLKVQVLSEGEDATSLGESLAAQGLYMGCAKSPADIAREIDQVNGNMVSQVIKRLYLHNSNSFNTRVISRK